MDHTIFDDLAIKNESKVVFFILDGLGGTPVAGRGGTELEVAATPNFDRLASSGLTGLVDPVSPGVTPGSGPGHFALFGYDPLTSNIGRGVLAALGIGFQLSDRDLAARINFATLDAAGKVSDRRAGRLPSEENRRLVEKLTKGIDLGSEVEVFIQTIKEHRALLVIRGDGLSDGLDDTDPQRTGVPPLDVEARNTESERAARLVQEFVSQARRILSDEPRANGLLLRGFARYRKYPSLTERFGMRAVAIAAYPMYKGIARLLGMEVRQGLESLQDELDELKRVWSDYDFFFVHFKATDKAGEDGDFEAKVRAIEEADSVVQQIVDLDPDVLVITGDHATPSLLASHSWHPVPVLMTTKRSGADTVDRFGERWCAQGALGRFPMKYLMHVALANAGRLEKFGA